MALSIKNNLMAANAARHLGTSYDSLAKSVERLSSGLRINSAKDDAAGLAVRELVRANIATLQQGARNARDGISMVQTAEGAMQVVDDILVRMKELAEQAATASYSDAQRTIMNAEFQQLGAEITRIAESTSFNDIKLLDSTETYAIHIASTSTVDIVAEKMDAGTLGLLKTKTVAGNDNMVSDTSAATFYTSDGTAFEFTFGAETQVSVTGGPLGLGTTASAGGDAAYSMAEVITLINTEAGYSAASAVYSSETKLYTLKLTASGAGAEALTIDTGADALATGEWTSVTGSDTGQEITTAAKAITALTNIDDAINTKDNYRAKLGYWMNRLDAASSVLDIQSENLLVAESRVSDVDVATEVADMTRTQVLTQAGIAMLAQANSMPQMALTLLQ